MSTKSYLITLIWCCKAKKNEKTCSMNLVCLPLMLNSNNTLTNLTKANLVDLGIAILGNIKTIRNLAQLINPNSNTIQTFPANLSNASNNTFINASNTIFMKAPPAKSPHLLAEMTHSEFQKFKLIGIFLKWIEYIPQTKIQAQLYNSWGIWYKQV